ncbi:hypothetical protein SO802_022624 [Lithocarpus litseifolius]|uniref:Uncharacterized protein n=1 Tax=Lithocarpus litseifolius TaxID=425828 RepID=A0AAW2C5G1_9ROSI
MLIQEFYSNMHGFDYSVPPFVTRVRGTRIVVTQDIVYDVLHVPRVEHPDYLGCDVCLLDTPDKLIFSSAITRLLRHFSVPFPVSDHFFVMGAIDAATIKQNEAQFRSRRSGSAALPTTSAPSTSAPFSSAGGVTLDAIMAQLQHMDAHLDMLTDELCQVNTCVGHIARRQACLGGFIESPYPPPAASDDDESNDNDDEDDGDASSSNIDKMST